MKYNVNIREEIFGATVSIVETGKREYVNKEELKKILEEKKFPKDTLANKMTEDYKIKYIPLNNKNLREQFSFADIVYLELTRECNLRCKHCLNNSGKLMPNQLNLDELKKLIQDLIDAGVQEIRFTGGEPLMCDGIYELIKLANDNGVCTSIGTNGTLVTEEIANMLKEIGLKKVVVSIDGTQEMHDTIRGTYSYEKAIKGLDYLKNAGLNVRVNTVIMKSNMEDVIKLAKEMDKNKITLFIRRFIESGRGKNLKNNMLTEDDYRYVREQLQDIMKKNSYINGHYLRNNEGVHSRIELPFIIRGCKAGQRAIAIMPDGDIQLCGFLSAQEFPAIENARNIHDWRKFWNELQKIDKLKYLRDNLDEYNKQPNVQETYCLAYIQRYLNDKTKK